MRAVTSVAVREARLKEIKTELLNSSKLKVKSTKQKLYQINPPLDSAMLILVTESGW